MISFRYHLVSIVAVFLALALGVLIGTTVVNQTIIADLDRRTEAASQSADELRREVSDMRAEIQLQDQFAQAALPLLIEDQLVASEVVLMTLEGVDASDVDGVGSTLRDAGASVVAEMVVTARMALVDDGARTELAALLEMSDSGDPVELSQAAGRSLGSRLAQGPDSVDGDLLQELATAGFVDIQTGRPLAEIGGEGQAVVLLAGGIGDPVVDPEAFLAPLAEALAHAVRPVVAAETLESDYPFVQVVRNNGSIDGRLVTVDNADQVPGRIAIVLGLRNLLQSPGQGGNYGVKQGASGLLPQP